MLNALEFNKYQLTEYFHSKNNRNRQAYFVAWWEKNKQEYNLKRRQKYATKKVKKQSLLEKLIYQHQTKTNYSCFCPENKYCNNCWFFDEQDNFVDYKFNPKNVGEKSVGEKSLHTRRTLAINARNKEAFFFSPTGEIAKRLDREEMRLATKDKRPLKRGWNQPWFKEWLSKNKLIERYREWSIRGGKRMGNKFLSFLDVDIFKEDLPLSLQQIVKEKLKLILGCLDCFYVETKKGYHVYILSDELLPNEILYHTDKFGNKRVIGSIQSKGKYVVGFDSPNKKLIENGKWFWHVKDLEEVKGKLGKFFVEVGKKETEREVELLVENQPIIKEPLKAVELNKPQNQLSPKVEYTILAKILSKQKIPCLVDLVKVWCKNLRTGVVNYFLLNDYQHSYILPNLSIGSIKNIYLIQGTKHAFFSRMRL